MTRYRYRTFFFFFRYLPSSFAAASAIAVALAAASAAAASAWPSVLRIGAGANADSPPAHSRHCPAPLAWPASLLGACGPSGWRADALWVAAAAAVAAGAAATLAWRRQGGSTEPETSTSVPGSGPKSEPAEGSARHSRCRLLATAAVLGALFLAAAASRRFDAAAHARSLGEPWSTFCLVFRYPTYCITR